MDHMTLPIRGGAKSPQVHLMNDKVLLFGVMVCGTCNGNRLSFLSLLMRAFEEFMCS